MLLADTYLVLDVPEPFASAVISLRQQFQDPFRAKLPAEVTIIGSSGVGAIAPEQPIDHLLDTVRQVARVTAPIPAHFAAAHRFPSSDVFVFPVQHQGALSALHAQLAGAGLHTRLSQWPFFPHCTLRSKSPIDDATAHDLLRQELPGAFVLESLSVYTTQGLPELKLVERVRLAGSPP